MRQNRNIVAIAGVGVGVAGLIISAISLLVDVGSLVMNPMHNPHFLVKKTDRFSCELRTDPETG